MAKTHPHAEASYSVIPLDDGSFGVEVSIPGSHPTKVSAFASEPDAEAWIAQHKSRVSVQNAPNRWFRRSPAEKRNS